MTVYFQGAEYTDFAPSSAWGNTDGGNFNAANARSSMFLRGTGQWIDTHPFSASSFWVHYRVFTNPISTGSGTTFLEFFSGGSVRLALRYQPTVELVKIDGATTLLETSTPFAYVTGTALVDVNVVLGNPGRVSMYVNGGPILSRNDLNLTWSGVSAIDMIRIKNPNVITVNYNVYYSEVIVADWNTINSKLVTRIPNAAGTYNDWTGAYTAVDEASPANDFISSNTADQRFSANVSDFSALTAGQTIENVRVHSWALRDAAGPQNMNLFLRTGGSDYDAADQTLNVAATGRYNDWALNPNTSGAWTISELNALEIGVRSRT